MSTNGLLYASVISEESVILMYWIDWHEQCTTLDLTERVRRMVAETYEKPLVQYRLGQ